MSKRSYRLEPLPHYAPSRSTGASHALHLGGRGQCCSHEIEYFAMACADNTLMELLGKHWVATGESLLSSHKKPVETLIVEIEAALEKQP